ncbi:MAG: hypothetical protein C4329_07205 [Chitinophagaceae bacterium]
MKNKFHSLFLISACLTISASISSCQKDSKPSSDTSTSTTTTTNGSFVEEFNNVSDLTSKGWAFVNNSNPIGQSGWRQGRYEAQAGPNYKFPDPFIGFPAYSAETSPNDFVSCDVSAVNYSGNISAWLISPKLSMSNGDTISFYTRAVDDTNYPVYVKDRMQVRGNFTDGTANVGTSSTSVGSFTVVLLDINPTYVRNDPSGYPRGWTKKTIIVSGIPGTGSITNGRFAFRYMGTNCGVDGGSANANYAGVVGVDQLKFVHK